MDTARRNIRCQVYLHPAAASNPATIRKIQEATGQLVVINCASPGRATLNLVFSTGHPDPFPADISARRFTAFDQSRNAPAPFEDLGPWGGAA